MRITTVALLLVVVLLTSAAGAEVIRVVPLDVSDNAVFSCGDRCKFRGSLPNEPLRVRIIRGTVAELAAMTNDRRYAAAGCIELYSTLVRPRRSRRTADLLDLKFYFSTHWLALGGANGQFVFIVERDDNPEGADIERTSMLRLPAGPEGARYFRAGVDVAVRAPVNVASSGGFWTRLFGRSASASPAMATAAMTMGTTAGSEPETIAEPAPPLTAAMPHATAAANCVDVQIGGQSIPIRRADAPPRKGPVRVAVK
jgi:hypothetical protein